MRDELNAHLPPGPNSSCLFRWLFFFFFLLLSILPTVSLPVLLHSPTQAAHFLHYIPKAPWIFYHAWDNQPQDSQFLRPRLGRLLAFVKRYPPSAWEMLDKVVWCPLFAVICFFSQCEAAQPSPPMLIILLHSKSSTLPASSGHNLFVWSLRAEFSFCLFAVSIVFALNLLSSDKNIGSRWKTLVNLCVSKFLPSSLVAVCLG